MGRHSEPNPTKKGTLFIIAAPSGAGKTTLVRELCKLLPGLAVSISYTTRPQRADEKEGVDYYFVDDTAFDEMIRQDRFLEYETVYDHRYGTPSAWVEEQLNDGNDVILEIDWQGARDVRRIIPDCVSIFILPPSLWTLENRLRERGKDLDSAINKRMHAAKDELSHYTEFDYLVKNDDLDKAVTELKTIIESIRLGKPCNIPDYKEFAARLMAENGDFR